MNPHGFTKRWVFANTIGFLVGMTPYTPIAHGVTGPHFGSLTIPQIVMHSIAFGLAAVVVTIAQRRILARYIEVKWIRIPLAALFSVLAYWLGAYQPFIGGPDWDSILGWSVLGVAAWIGTLKFGRRVFPRIFAYLGFPIGCFLGQFVLVTIASITGIKPDLQNNMLQHSVWWIGTGVFTGSIGGLISGLALRNVLPEAKKENSSL